MNGQNRTCDPAWHPKAITRHYEAASLILMLADAEMREGPLYNPDSADATEDPLKLLLTTALAGYNADGSLRPLEERPLNDLIQHVQMLVWHSFGMCGAPNHLPIPDYGYPS